MAVIEVPLENLGEFLIEKTKRFSKSVPEIIETFLYENKMMSERELELGYGKTGLRVCTGRLIQGTFTKIGQIKNGAEMVVDNRVPYAPYLELGTKPHKIYPKSPGGVLHWTDESGDHFAKSVNHPGTRAYKFLENPSYTVASILERKLPAYLRRRW